MELIYDVDNTAFDQWLDKNIPTIPSAQLNKFSNFQSADVQKIGEFSPSIHAQKLSLQSGKRVVGIDSGGGSVRGGVYVIEDDGSLTLTNNYSETTAAENGEGFLAQFERFSAFATKNDIPVGISYGGPLDGSKPRYHPKIPILMEELSKKYEGDFVKIFETRTTILNDGLAGLIRSVEMVYRSGIDNPIVFYLINGGGLGLAVYKDGCLYSTEAGHVESVTELNVKHADRPCGLYGDHVCLENVISNKQGLERQWKTQTGVALNGKEIEDEFRKSNPLAELMYEQVAVAQAAIIQGMATVFEIDINDPRFETVVHGGMQRTPNLRKRTAQILWQQKAPDKTIRFTEEFDQNACMHGAALNAGAW